MTRDSRKQMARSPTGAASLNNANPMLGPRSLRGQQNSRQQSNSGTSPAVNAYCLALADPCVRERMRASVKIIRLSRR
jgi:hypothetical protein